MKRIFVLLFLCWSSIPVQLVSGKVLYPIALWEGEENGQKKMIKTYELKKTESPSSLPKENFEQGGWWYEFVDMVKQKSSPIKKKVVQQIQEREGNTKEKEAVLSLFPTTIPYQDKYGYQGTLHLETDRIVQRKERTSTHLEYIQEKRAYPHLSSNDPAFLPKTITKEGSILTLSHITWKTTEKKVEDHKIPIRYTAMATYQGNVTRNRVTGYLFQASYSGKVTRSLPEKTQYAIHYIGTKIPKESILIAEAKMPLSKAESITKMTGKDGILIGIGLALVVISVLYWKERRKGVWRE